MVKIRLRRSNMRKKGHDTKKISITESDNKA